VLDQLRERIRYLHYSIRTEEVYVYWVRTLIRFHGLRHPATLGGAKVEAFLFWLANTRNVAASTHKQALSALFFLRESARRRLAMDDREGSAAHAETSPSGSVPGRSGAHLLLS
jgi:hypothetical protein